MLRKRLSQGDERVARSKIVTEGFGVQTNLFFMSLKRILYVNKNMSDVTESEITWLSFPG